MDINTKIEIVPNWNIGVYYVKQDGVTLGGFHEKKYAELFLDAVILKQQVEANHEKIDKIRELFRKDLVDSTKQKMVSLKDIFSGNV